MSSSAPKASDLPGDQPPPSPSPGPGGHAPGDEAGGLSSSAGLAELQQDPANFARIFLRLRTVEARLEQMLSLFPGVVFHQRPDFSFAFVGPGFEALLGLDPQPLARNGQPLLRLIHEQDERAFHAELERAALAERPFSSVYRVLNPQTGAYVYLLDIRKAVRSPSGLLLGYEGIWLDITRQKIAEDRLSSRS
jgi:PAS domain S-box-containing protein